MNKEDFENFEECFQHIDDILKVLVDELDQQIKDQHMAYVIEWGKDLIYGPEDLTDKDKVDGFIRIMVRDAFLAAIENAACKTQLDPWSRIKGFMALRLKPEEVQSPIAASEYEEIKTIAIEAERQKPINLESVPVNMQRPEWTEAEQMALIMKKEKE